MIRWCVIVALAGVASGCATPATPPFPQDRADTQWASHVDAMTAREPAYLDVQEPWLGGRFVARQNQAELPAALGDMVTFRRLGGVTLTEAAEWIISTYGIRVVVTADAAENAASIKRPSPMDLLAKLPPLPGPDAAPAGPQVPPVGGRETDAGLTMSYSGTLAGFLDELAAMLSATSRGH